MYVNVRPIDNGFYLDSSHQSLAFLTKRDQELGQIYMEKIGKKMTSWMTKGPFLTSNAVSQVDEVRGDEII
ncbi:hypothetical protein HI914_02874 [Erysiphe necator]|nr:hypothetical protein HI914_02874 [Erysiphe necator]